MLRSDGKMLAGAGGYIPEWAGKRSKYMQGWAGRQVTGNLLVLNVLQNPARVTLSGAGTLACERACGVEGPLPSECSRMWDFRSRL